VGHTQRNRRNIALKLSRQSKSKRQGSVPVGQVSSCPILNNMQKRKGTRCKTGADWLSLKIVDPSIVNFGVDNS
jgi:hypothetical protein